MRTLTVLLFSLCLVSSVPAHGQSADDSWQPVRALEPGTSLHLKTKSKGLTCKLVSVEDDGLTCAGHGGAQTQVIPRSDITSIKLARRGVSAAGAAAIGAGVGAGIGAGVSGKGSFLPQGKSVGIGVALGAGVGAAIGFGSDLFRGPTIYNAK